MSGTTTPSLNELYMATMSCARHLQVSGLRAFGSDEWREAILYYLAGMRLGIKDVTYRPKIAFGPYTLRLEPECGRYYAYGPENTTPWCPRFSEAQVLMTSDSAQDVELALFEFVKTESIRMLVLCFNPQGYLFIWKDTEGGYSVSANNLPPSPFSRLR
ncbi:MAG: hypothetical protein HZA95_01785 [Candidatus Vogelbacteria bacterium]|nr:hypothetical protein [Candidatus Vogelbacteria bacterium]